MLLEGKNAIIYGEGGAIGGAVARALADEGATVFLAGRTPERLEEVAAQIRAAGGVAETSQVDALDERAIEEHVGEVVERVGSVDSSFNAISIRDVQLSPRLCGLAALGLVGLMAGATLTNGLVLGTSPLVPIVLLVVSAAVAWGRWRRTRTLLTHREARRLR